jgi:hypothetical protein
MNPNEESRAEIVEAANRARAKLLHTVEELDKRGHEVTDVRLQLVRHPAAVAFAASVGALALAGLAELVVRRWAPAPAMRSRERRELLLALLLDPRRTLREQRRPFLLDAVRSIALSTIAAIATIPVRHLLKRSVVLPREP